MESERKCSARAEMVARWFGVDLGGARGFARERGEIPRVELAGGLVILISGASGAGKSSLLREIRRRHGRGKLWIDLQRIKLPERAVVDVMAEELGGGGDEETIVAALGALSRVGLGEVWTYLRRPGELSEGQRWRLRLAMGMVRAGKCESQRRGWRMEDGGWRDGDGGRRRLCVLAADEFGGALDRVTGLVVARALRKAVSGRGDLCAVVASCRDDLIDALEPDLHVRCDFGMFNVSERGTS